MTDPQSVATKPAPMTGSERVSVSHTIGHSHVNTGWTLGYGTEGAIDFWGAHTWTWKIEALYMDLGHLNETGVQVSSVSGSGGQITANTHFTDWILRGGLNYRF